MNVAIGILLALAVWAAPSAESLAQALRADAAPQTSGESQRIERLLRDLDSPRFGPRQAAYVKLRRNRSVQAAQQLAENIQQCRYESSERRLMLLYLYSLDPESPAVATEAAEQLRRIAALGQAKSPLKWAVRAKELWSRSRDELERDAISYLTLAGATLHVDRQSESGVTIHIGETWVGGHRDLLQLHRVRGLQRIVLERSSVSDRDLAALDGLDQLRELCLGETQITSAGLRQLGSLNSLERLSLRGLTLGELPSSSFSRFPSLRQLDLAETDIDDARLEALSGVKQLEKLSLNGAAVTDAGLGRLAACSQLRELDLSGTRVSGSGLRRLAGSQLTHLSLRAAPISDDGLDAVAQLEFLRVLGLDQTELVDSQLERLKPLQKLEALWLSRTRVSDRCAGHLAELRGLKAVYVHGAPVTRKLSLLLALSLPQCRVER